MFFGKFKREFKVAPKSGSLTVDIGDDGFVINGNKLEIPITIDKLREILGKPRRDACRTSKRDKKITELLMHEYVSKRVNYVWDKFGMMCYTNNGTVVNAFAVIMNKPRVVTPSVPRALFGGRVRINGEDWHKAVLRGEDSGFSRHLNVGHFLIVSSYINCDCDNSECPRDNFSGVEISLLR